MSTCAPSVPGASTQCSVGRRDVTVAVESGAAGRGAGIGTHSPPETMKPALHTIPHVVPLQVAIPFVGTGHGEHDAPHVSGSVLLTHAPPHKWYPALHTNPHETPSHVDDALAGATHGAHDAPHDVGLVFDAHALPHA
jgi:hypothetical protein